MHQPAQFTLIRHVPFAFDRWSNYISNWIDKSQYIPTVFALPMYITRVMSKYIM